MGDTELQAEFARRVRRHLMILPLMVLAFAVPLTIGSFLKRIYWRGVHPPAGFNVTIALVIGAAFLITIGYGFWSTSKNLRCPKCETNVWYMVSRNASLVFSSDEDRTHCPSCDAAIVGPILRQRTKRLMLLSFVGGLAFSVAGIVIRAILGK
jgi:hypothetical protein